MRRAPRYFIRVSTYWERGGYGFVGPFSSRAEAEVALAALPTTSNARLASSLCGGDIRDAVRVYDRIISATEAKAWGMNEEGDEYGNTNVLPRIPHNAQEFGDMLDPEGAYWCGVHADRVAAVLGVLDKYPVHRLHL